MKDFSLAREALQRVRRLETVRLEIMHRHFEVMGWAIHRVLLDRWFGPLSIATCHVRAPGHCMTRWFLEVDAEGGA